MCIVAAALVIAVRVVTVRIEALFVITLVMTALDCYVYGRCGHA